VARFRFYGPLNDFLPWQWRHCRFAHALRGPASVKDVIESLGIPHPEVDVIVVNGQAAEFTYRMQDGDDVAVYPAFHSVDVTGLHRVGTDPPQPVRFVLDVHLRKLAALLRLAGFDALLLTGDAEIAEVSAAEGRVALTRDVGLLKRSIIQHGYWVRQTNPELQFVEVLQRFDLVDRMDPFVRCMECNTLLVPVDVDTVAERLPPGTRECFSRFHRCPGCDRVYSQGSHYDRLVQLLERARGRST
jgi:uncharacterized protein with PIN domain/sulfur carrier protein ThiS